MAIVAVCWFLIIVASHGCHVSATSDARVTQDQPVPCLENWLKLAGASTRKARHLAMRAEVKRSGLDDQRVKELSNFVIGILLGFDEDLAGALKSCVLRNASCPAGAARVDLPCSDTGDCVYSPELQTTRCQCPFGLRGNQCEADIDECANRSLNECARKEVAICHNIHASYVCECKEGYEGNGRLCEDVNECMDNTPACAEHADCNNTIGSFTCTCRQGYKGDGQHCEVDVCSGSGNTALCQRIERMESHIERMETKLKIREKQIKAYLRELKLMSSVFTRHHYALKATDDRVARLENDASEKCGVVNWQNFVQTSPSKSNNMIVWNHEFYKKRNDTAIRITYSTMLGVQAQNTWSCLAYSILLNGQECADPAPIMNTVGLHGSSDSNVYNVAPTVITGTCQQLAAGLIRLTTRATVACSRQWAGEGKHRGPTTPPASMFVEELSPC
ncbi:uncharacterized protein LOC135824632 [Sycon ciliatum]|uniref:uncharacterized protein LOC135824632 n=1 Tax=Sycon ciliatum TaxID=27933 RepID=UPI0031F6BABA